jgi:HlyD family secretion protein
MAWLGGGVVVVAGLAALGLREPARSVSIGEVARGAFVQSFTEEGRTRLEQRYTIAAPVPGTVSRIDREPGEAVRAGEALATLSPSTAALLDPSTRNRAQAEARAAAAAVGAARQRAAAAEAARALAARERERAEDLRARGLVSASVAEQAAASALQAEASASAARAEVRAAEQRRAAADALLEGEGREGGRGIPLLAPVAGVIVRRFQESEGPVAAGQALLEVGDPTRLEIEVEALSTDAVGLAPGMAARVVRWGGGEALPARVLRVEPGGFTKVSALGVEEQRTRVILAFDAPRERWAALGDGFRVEVEFILFSGDAVLQVPSAALVRRGERWLAYVSEGGRAREVVVVPGRRAGAVTEVSGGLEAGQQVVLDPDDQVRDGSRLAPLPE